MHPGIPYFNAEVFNGLTSEMKATFDRDGVLVLEGLVSAETCRVLMERMAALVDGFDAEAHSSVFSSVTNEQQNEAYFLESGGDIRFFFEEGAFGLEGDLLVDKHLALNKVGHALHDRDPIFSGFSRNVNFKKIAQDLDIREPLLAQSMYIFKQPKIGGEVVCHQDSPYLWTEPASCVGLWIALEDATIENGCLWGIPGEHKEDAPRGRLRRVGDHETHFDVLDDTPWPEEKRVPLEVKTGTVIVLHGQFPHLSGPNSSDKSRHAYALHLVDGACHYPSENWLQRGSDDPMVGF